MSGRDYVESRRVPPRRCARCGDIDRRVSPRKQAWQSSCDSWGHRRVPRRGRGSSRVLHPALDAARRSQRLARASGAGRRHASAAGETTCCVLSKCRSLKQAKNGAPKTSRVGRIEAAHADSLRKRVRRLDELTGTSENNLTSSAGNVSVSKTSSFALNLCRGTRNAVSRIRDTRRCRDTPTGPCTARVSARQSHPRPRRSRGAWLEVDAGGFSTCSRAMGRELEEPDIRWAIT